MNATPEMNDEYRPQCRLPPHPHADDQIVRKKRVDPHTRRQTVRQVGVQPHGDGADRRN